MYLTDCLAASLLPRVASHWKLWLPNFLRQVPFHVEVEYEEANHLFAYRTRELPQAVHAADGANGSDPMQMKYDAAASSPNEQSQ